MSIHTSTMSNSYSSSNRLPDFLRKLVTIFSFVIGVAALMALLNVYQTNLSPLLMTIFAILSIGLAAGSGARAVFYEWSGFIRFVIILFALPIGLFILGFLTNWQMGIGPLDPWIAGKVDWPQLIQLSGALLVAIISLSAWWKHRPKVENAPEVRGSSRQREQPSTASVQSVQPRSSQSQSQERFTFLPRRSSRPKISSRNGRSGSRTRTTSAADKVVLTTHTAQPARSKFKRLFSRKPSLQLSLYEEHRCPFCLEEVKRNDPRGVKKCEVCNTLHHADCWAVTGMCQVPHLNT